MSFNNLPNDGNSFFDFSGMFGQNQTNDPWEAAAEIATKIASDGGNETNVDPLSRASIEDLTRVAELQVKQAATISIPTEIEIETVTKGEWSKRSLEAYRPFFENFGEAISKSAEQEQPSGSDPMQMMMSNMLKGLGPMLVATSAGSMLGHLGSRAMGQYDLPIPRKTDQILIVATTLDKVAYELEIPVEELRLWVLIHEYITHSLLRLPHVQSRLENLLIDFASAFTPNTTLIADQFGSISDLSQLEEISEQFSTPEAVLSMMRSPAHDLLIPQLDALLGAVLGYVHYMMDKICSPLISNHQKIAEKFAEQRISANPADQFMESLLGLDIDEETLHRGKNFINGIYERAGEEGIDRLWADELDLPTAAEVAAPGLWLARIGFDSDESIFEVPDDISGIEDI